MLKHKKLIISKRLRNYNVRYWFQLFDHCLAPNTLGDGTGCDNMTCVIVEFKSPELESKKRSAEESEEPSTKRSKLEEVSTS